MTGYIGVLKYFLVFCGGIAALAAIGIFCGCAVLFVASNWATVLDRDLVIIRRMIGWRTSIWYVSDEQRRLREFGIWTMGKEEFVLRRSMRDSVIFSDALWEIYHKDSGGNYESVISYYPDRTLEVREKLRGHRWSSFRLTTEELRDSRFGQSVARAETMQRDIEKRFKPLIEDRI